MGATGVAGDKGATGATGIQGQTGSTGATGPIAGTNGQLIYNDSGSPAGATVGSNLLLSGGTLSVTGLSPVATSGSYSDLYGRPSLGTAASLDSGSSAGNVVVLDGTSKVPSSLLPSYVDDVIEAANFGVLPTTGESGKIYVAIDTGKAYRWGGSSYLEIVASPGSTDAVPEGSTNLYFTNSRASLAAPVQTVAGRTGNVTIGATDVSGLASVATSGAYGDLSGRPNLGNSSSLNVGTTTGTVAAGDDSRFTELKNRLDAFRDAAIFYVSKRATASNSNNGTSDGEPFLTIAAAVSAANSYVSSNPGAYAKIMVGPGEYVESGLPFRLKPNILAQGSLQRGTIVKPATGEELNGFFALDSGCMVVDFRFAGHQATGTSPTDSSVGQRAWAISFNNQANSGQGVYLTASPYVKDCASITAEDDSGLAGSTSVGDTGGGVEVDGAKCKSDSPIRSMVVYGFTQQNLGGPGCVVKNDAYAELVSFFGLFGTWHVQAEKGGQVTLSGGGCSEFGTYGLVADGYSATALFTGSLRVSASAGATTVDVISMTSNRLGSSSRPAAGQIMIIDGVAYVVQSGNPIDASGSIVADSDPTRAGYRVDFYNPSASGLAENAAQGSMADFRQRSQIGAGCHSANYVGSGTNYNALPWNGGVPIRANEVVERNLGRVFGLIVNDVGDVKVAGGAFSVDGTTGSVTVNTSQFNLSGLNAIGPFSRNGGVSTVGVQLQEVSNNATLLASTGSSDGNTAPTLFAVRSYVDNRFLAGLTATAGQPLTVSDTSTQDGNGFWTRSRNVSLSMNVANGLARLDGSGLIPSSLLPSYVDDVVEGANLSSFPTTGETGKIYVALDSNKTYRWSGSTYVEISASPGSTDSVTEGGVNLYFTAARARQSISVSGSLGYDPVTGVISYTSPILATVATSGAYSDLSGKPTLGTSASRDVGTIAGTVAAGDDSRITGALSASIAASTYQPLDPDLTSIAALGTTTFGRSLLTQADAPSTRTTLELGSAATASIGTTAGTVAAGDDSRITGALSVTTAASTYQPLSANLTALGANNPSYYLSRANHTGTQGASTITGLATVATTGSYSDLSNRPTLPSGTIVGTTDTQTLTNKTLGGITETIFAITDGASVDLNPSNGSIQTWTLGASRTATANNFPAGASMLLCVNDGSAFTLTWPTITWVGSTTAPTLATTGFTFIQMWKIGTTLYGMAQK